MHAIRYNSPMSKKKSTTKKRQATDLIAQNKIFAWIAAATLVILLIPLIAMQASSEVNWALSDFIIMGFLLFGAGSALVLVARLASKKYRLLAVLAVTAVFMYIWAELAVGVFTTLGS